MNKFRVARKIAQQTQVCVLHAGDPGLVPETV